MSEILLYHYGGSDNHGCEAIVRTITDLMKNKLPDVRITVATERPHRDKMFFTEEEGINFIKAPRISGDSFAEKVMRGCALFFHSLPFFSLQFKNNKVAAKKADVVISIGGDIYSYGGSSAVTVVDNHMRCLTKKSVLWGCSINKEFLDPDKYSFKIKGLSDFDLIIARESLTYQSLTELGLKQTVLLPDPAFTLKPSGGRVDLFSNGHGTIGINTSPLIFNYEQSDGILFRAWTKLVNYILSQTDFNVAFIPHVESETDGDYACMKKIYDAIDDKSRVKMIPIAGCAELKRIISSCRMFIGARTHATIAAYSTCVPTLSVGYSVKSRGIARDLFGSDENLVIPVQSIVGEDDMIKAFCYLESHEDELRKRLVSVMPNYIARAEEAADLVASLLCE